MRALTVLKSVMFTAAIVGVTKSGAAVSGPAPKVFAVFVASYNTHNDVVRGGVCGSLFFVSPTHAITAHHVLNAKSFNPLPGFERVRVWLVHEGYPAIEIKPGFIHSTKDVDLTVVDLPRAERVESRFVYQTGTLTAVDQRVETEGFLANTTGPTLVRQGQDIRIVSVPHLERRRAEGRVVRAAIMNLKAPDLELKSSPDLELTYQPVVGLSGGPVVLRGKVVGMNSFADPWSFKHTWALQLDKIRGGRGG